MFVDSKKEMLDQMALLRNAFENSRTPYTVEEGIAAVIAESRMPNCIMMRQGNGVSSRPNAALRFTNLSCKDPMVKLICSSGL